jgi:Ser-tRNA(Ala) deacylase AlaX
METTSTTREYYFDSYLFNIDAIVTDKKNEEGFWLKFDKTIFHPQGGGQPADEGYIITSNQEFYVLKLACSKDSDDIWHQVNPRDYDFKIGEKVSMKINAENRKTFARLHSAGHLIDICVSDLNMGVSAVKGYHFPEGPYVEYAGTLPSNLEEVREKIENYCNEKISATDDLWKVQSGIYSYEEALKLFKVPEYVSKDKPTRFLRLIESDYGRPCGGTHVKHIKEIGKLIISKVIKKGKNLRISYLIK